MSEPLPDLDPDALALLKSFQTVGTRSPQAVDAALAATVGAAKVGASGAAGSSVVLKVLGVALVSSAVGLVAWAVTREPTQGQRAASPVEAVVRAEPEPALDAPTQDEPVAPAVLPEPAVERPAEVSTDAVVRPPTQTKALTPGPSARAARRKPAGEPEPRGEASPAAEPAPATSVSLMAELRLLRRARTALKTHDPQGALRVTAEHRREHPDGELAEERDATEVTALCQLGLRSKAEKKATAFRRAFPDSERDVLGACVGAAKTNSL